MIRIDSREAAGLFELGTRCDHVEGHMYLGAQQPSFDDGAVQHGFLLTIILRPFDVCDEGVLGVIGDDLIQCLELNDVAIVESSPVQNRRGKVARSVAAAKPGGKRQALPIS